MSKGKENKVFKADPVEMAKEQGEVAAMEAFAKHFAPILDSHLQKQYESLYKRLNEFDEFRDQMGPIIQTKTRKIYIGPIVWYGSSAVALITAILFIYYTHLHPY